MTHLLDTNICIAFLNGEVAIRDRLLAMHPQDVCTSAVVRAELCFGALASARPAANLRKLRALWTDLRCLPVDEAVAEDYGAVRSELKRLGTPVGPNDLFIAATARVHGLTLVTRNIREYAHVPRLDLERW
jgi:tRNA(fMet)-specific endonuclease VapC